MAHAQHNHGPANYGRAFAIGVVLNLGFVLVELFYGSQAHSLALVSDAVHNFSDVFALLLSWGASILVRQRATRLYTYGFRRTSILAALINAVILLLVTGAIAWEAIQRFGHPDQVGGQTMIGIAALGIVINAATAFLFLSGRNADLNIRSAFLHMAADALVALGVVIAGLAILLTGWWWLDPVISLLIAGVLLAGTWGLLRASVNLALDAVPEGIDLQQVQNYLEQLPDVRDVHDLHIWGMSTTEVALTAHLVMRSAQCDDALTAKAAEELHDKFGIEHVTLQRETGDLAHPCSRCPEPFVETPARRQSPNLT